MTIEGIGWSLAMSEGDELKIMIEGRIKGTLSYEDLFAKEHLLGEVFQPAKLYWTDESGRVEVLG